MNLWGWLFRRRQSEEELEEEVRSHLRMAAKEHLEQGESPEQARVSAVREFGNVGLVKEVTRDVWGWGWFERLMQDVRYGLRMLARNPGFTVVAVLTLALGIGANTAIFSVINVVMLKALPVKDPGQLVLLRWVSKDWPKGIRSYSSSGGCPVAPAGSSRGCSFSYPSFEQIRTQNHAFSSVLAFVRASDLNLVANGIADVASAEAVSGGYFSTLGIQPILGRVLTEEDGRPEAPPAAVLSYGCWQRRFGGDRAVLGKVVALNRVAVTIVGVTPPEFFGLEPGFAQDVWIPLTLMGRVRPIYADMLGVLKRPDDWWWNLMGRFKPGVSREAARAELDLIFQRSLLANSNSQSKPQDLPHIELGDGSKGLALLRQQFSKPLFILMAFVALVLLIACANVTNLLLARAAARRKEIAVRMATGAGRMRLVRQLLTESVLLAGLGGAFGLLLAYWGVSVLAAFISTGSFASLNLEVHPDLRVLSFTAAVSALTGILFGLAPALWGTRLDLTQALKEGNHSMGGGSRHRWLSLRNSMVVAQIALSLVLLICAALFVRTLDNLEHVNAGFDRHNLLLFGLDGTQSGYQGERLKSFYQEVQDRLASLPGVLSASSSDTTLVSGNYMSEDITIPGYSSKAAETISPLFLHVGPGFFETMGISTLLGRTIDRRDNQNAAKVAVINQAMARRYFPGPNPVGRRFTLGGKKKEDLIEIVGVIDDAKYGNLRDAVTPTVYLPYLQSFVWGMHFELRTAGNPLDLVPSVRRVVQSLDKGLPLTEVKRQTEQIDQSLFQERLFARLSSLFGVLALLLASVGIYGVMAYAVRTRTNEIGIRLALGAGRSGVLGLFVREGLSLAAVGIVLGVAGALALTRVFSSVLGSAQPSRLPVAGNLLYGLRANDPATFVVASLALAAATLLACFIPARRAAKVDPMVALRYE